MEDEKLEKVVGQMVDSADKEKLVEKLRNEFGDRDIGGSMQLKGKATLEEKDPDTGEVIDSETKENVVVYDAGANQIANYIAGNTPASHFEYMAIGSDGTTEGTGDTQLGTQEKISTAITPSIVGDGSGNNRVVQWVYTFSAGSGSTDASSIEEMGMFNGNTGSGTDGMLNRVTFTAKDNLNNDLEITYELTVGTE